jgi:hypothetical protein
MLNRRLLIGWIVYAGIVGFALGGSFISAYLMPPPQHQGDTDNDHSAAEQNSKQETDKALARYTWWLTAFTGVLALATIALCIATIGLYVAGEKHIEVALKAANAAETSAKAAIAIELPVIRMNPEDFSWGVTQTPDAGRVHQCNVRSFSFFNHGRTTPFRSKLGAAGPPEIACQMFRPTPLRRPSTLVQSSNLRRLIIIT